MTIIDTSIIAEYAGGISAGLLGTAFLLQKLLLGWKTDKTEVSVISLLHAELERMSSQNTNLSLELGTLQKDLIELNKELRKLSSENQRLHGEVTALTMEVGRLQTLINKGI